MAIAAVTGLEAEARIVRGVGLAAMASGADPARTAAMAERMLAGGAAALMSFGLAGALASDLRSGTILLPRRILGETGGTADVDRAWHARQRAALLARGIAPVEDDLFGAGLIVARHEAKAALHRRTGAVAVDLESAAAAAVARRFGRPFLALRAVADPADFDLPPAALVGIDADGRTAYLPVLRSVLADPRQIAALVRLAQHTRAALAALARAAATVPGAG